MIGLKGTPSQKKLNFYSLNGFSRISCKYSFLDLSFLVRCGRLPPNFWFPKRWTFPTLRTFLLQFLNKNQLNCQNSIKMTQMEKFYKARCLLNPSIFQWVTAFLPIFVKELEYKCSESGDEMFGNWKNECLALEAQIKKNKFRGHSREPIEPIEILYFSTPGPL